MNPIYAIPSKSFENFDMIIRKDESTAQLKFCKLADVLDFQQGLTGYKVWDAYSPYVISAGT